MKLSNIINGMIDGVLFWGVAAVAMGAPLPSVVPHSFYSPLSSWQGATATEYPLSNCYSLNPPLSDYLAPNPPYEEFTGSQDIHGCGYGHAAVDIVGVNDKTILSPINGRVIKNGYDGIGNTVLVIENEQYTITMLHGVYEVEGAVSRGQRVGVEASIGNSYSPHTHLSIYDRTIGKNVPPYSVMARPTH